MRTLWLGFSRSRAAGDSPLSSSTALPALNQTVIILKGFIIRYFVSPCRRLDSSFSALSHHHKVCITAAALVLHLSLQPLPTVGFGVKLSEDRGMAGRGAFSTATGASKS